MARMIAWQCVKRAQVVEQDLHSGLLLAPPGLTIKDRLLRLAARTTRHYVFKIASCPRADMLMT